MVIGTSKRRSSTAMSPPKPTSRGAQKRQSASPLFAPAPPPRQDLLQPPSGQALPVSHGSSKAPSQCHAPHSARSAATCTASKSLKRHPSSGAPSQRLPAAPRPPGPSRRPSPSPSFPESSSSPGFRAHPPAWPPEYSCPYARRESSQTTPRSQRTSIPESP